MATQKRSNGKSTAKRKSAAEKRREQEVRDTRRKLSVVLFVVGALLAALAFVKDGSAPWLAARGALMGIFGPCGYALGLFVVYWAVLLVLNTTIWDDILKTMVLFITLCGTLTVFSNVDIAGMDLAQAVQALYSAGQTSLFSGGVLGMILGGTLLMLCGRPAANIILAVLFAAGGMLFTGIGPADLWQSAAEWLAVRKAELGEELAERRAAREAEGDYEEAEEEEAPEPLIRSVIPIHRRKAQVDIDLGPDPESDTNLDETPQTDEPLVGPGGTFGMFPPRHEEPEDPERPELEELFGRGGSLLDLQPDTGTVDEPDDGEKAARSGEAAQAADPEPQEDFSTPVSVSPAEPEAEPATPNELAHLIRQAVEPTAKTQQDTGAVLPDDKNGDEEPTAPEYHLPPMGLLKPVAHTDDTAVEEELKRTAATLVSTLESFGVKTRVLDISRGPTVTRYEVQPLAGVKISRITNLADDIALNLAAAGVRIEAPIPGKPAVGIEVPNKVKSGVGIRGILESSAFQRAASPLTLALGKDIAGMPQVADLCKMPHLLIAGSTGSGKSVCVNSIIISFLYRASPEEVKLILIDPKVVELAEYNGIPHLLMPVVTEPRKAAGALGSAVAEMERRYHLFAETGVRDIKSFNKMAQDNPEMEKLPYIAIVIDELADLMMVAGKEVEDYICRIAQKARAAGMHLIVATQRPSVDVITGLIKANIPSRIAFAVASQVDSRTILDGAGAEKLLGKGDMLFMPVGASKPVRVQGTLVEDEEITAVLNYIKKDNSAQYNEEMIAQMEKCAAQEKSSDSGDGDGEGGGHDPMLKNAVEVVIDAGQASTSLLQRRCKLGYARAARIMDEMEQMHIIGPYEGAKPRQVLISRTQWLEMCARAENPVPEEI